MFFLLQSKIKSACRYHGLLRWLAAGLCLWIGVVLGSAHGFVVHVAAGDDNPQMTFIIQTASTHEPVVGATV